MPAGPVGEAAATAQDPNRGVPHRGQQHIQRTNGAVSMGYPHYSGDCDEYHALVRDFGSPDGGVDHRARPEIVCLCGSTRFYDEFQQANYDLTMNGKIVLSVGFYPHAKAKHGHGEGVGHDSDEKVALDELHKRKIDLADRVLVLNVGGYIGESTRSEIAYAHQVGRPVDYLEADATNGAA